MPKIQSTGPAFLFFPAAVAARYQAPSFWNPFVSGNLELWKHQLLVLLLYLTGILTGAYFRLPAEKDNWIMWQETTAVPKEVELIMSPLLILISIER